MADDLGENQYHIMVIQVKGPKTRQALEDYVEAVQEVLDEHGAEIQRKVRVLQQRQD